MDEAIYQILRNRINPRKISKEGDARRNFEQQKDDIDREIWAGFNSLIH